MGRHKGLIPDTYYRRGYRLWNKVCGRFIIRDVDHPSKRLRVTPLPNGPHTDLAYPGVVVLEGWISS